MTLAEEFEAALKARPNANIGFVRLTEREEILCGVFEKRLAGVARRARTDHPRFDQE